MQTNFRKDNSYYLKKEEQLKTALANECKKSDDNLRKIEKYVLSHKELDIKSLVDKIIFRQLVTKDKLTNVQLYESTKDIVLDILAN